MITRLFPEKWTSVDLSAAPHLGRVKCLGAFAEGSGRGESSSAGFAFPVPLRSFENNIYMLSTFMKKREADEGDWAAGEPKSDWHEGEWGDKLGEGGNEGGWKIREEKLYSKETTSETTSETSIPET